MRISPLCVNSHKGFVFQKTLFLLGYHLYWIFFHLHPLNTPFLIWKFFFPFCIPTMVSCFHASASSPAVPHPIPHPFHRKGKAFHGETRLAYQVETGPYWGLSPPDVVGLWRTSLETMTFKSDPVCHNFQHESFALIHPVSQSSSTSFWNIPIALLYQTALLIPLVPLSYFSFKRQKYLPLTLCLACYNRGMSLTLLE